jgi:hypothetical protein
MESISALSRGNPTKVGLQGDNCERWLEMFQTTLQGSDDRLSAVVDFQAG